MASTARTSITSAFTQATRMSSIRGSVGSLPCTCSSMLSRMHSRFQSTSAASTSTSTSSSSSIPPSITTASAGSSTTAAVKPKSSPSRQQQHLSRDTKSALALLRSQPSHYIITSIYQRRFLLTQTDIVTVPRLKDVKVGDVITLDKIHEVGSRDYTLRATDGEFLSSPDKEGVVNVRATVIEHTKSKMEATVKFKKRKGYTKTIKNKSRYTRLRIGEIVLGGEGK